MPVMTMRRALVAGLSLVTVTTVAAPKVSPSGETVPENLLRIELQLDRPLDAPLEMRRVVLLHSDGMPIPDALLDLPLPSRDGKEISILLHPGRIKTGVSPNTVLGLALNRGEVVTLVIDDPQFATPLRKSWQIVPAVREAVDPASWTIVLPTVNSRDGLSVDFPEALDSSAQDLIAVATPEGNRLAGHAELSKGETRWTLVPDEPWKPGRYELRAHPDLEDPAGNRVCSAFEQVGQGLIECNADVRLAFELGSIQIHHRVKESP
jgi:hypothetical protein